MWSEELAGLAFGKMKNDSVFPQLCRMLVCMAPRGLPKPQGGNAVVLLEAGELSKRGQATRPIPRLGGRLQGFPTPGSWQVSSPVGPRRVTEHLPAGGGAAAGRSGRVCPVDTQTSLLGGDPASSSQPQSRAWMFWLKIELQKRTV